MTAASRRQIFPGVRRRDPAGRAETAAAAPPRSPRRPPHCRYCPPRRRRPRTRTTPGPARGRRGRPTWCRRTVCWWTPASAAGACSPTPRPRGCCRPRPSRTPSLPGTAPPSACIPDTSSSSWSAKGPHTYSGKLMCSRRQGTRSVNKNKSRGQGIRIQSKILFHPTS